MYNQFFKFAQSPFSIAPDPRYLFMSERHREALAHLLYGVEGGGGFVLLTGEIGAGKTTVCRCFLEQIPDNCNVGYIFNPKLTVIELLQSICDEFGIGLPNRTDVPSVKASVKDYVDALNVYLLAAHAGRKNNVLVIDEAQNLSADVLEQLRLLTNLETNQRKLLQIILIGQPELRAMLARPELEQLAQRVIARYHLDSLSESETVRYIAHRLSVASLEAGSPSAEDEPFQRKAALHIHRIARGVPRRINLLCDRALLGAYAEGKRRVDRRILRKAAAEVFGNLHAGTAASHSRPALAGVVGLSIGLVAIAAWLLVPGNPNWKPVKPAVSAPASAPQKELTTTATPAAPVMPPAIALAHQDTAAQATVGVGNAAAAATAATAVPPPVVSNAPVELGTAFTGSWPDEAAIYGDLAKMWGLSLPVGEPCVTAQKLDLHCYRGAGGLAEIRQLDRPAVITLRDQANRTRPALLTGLTHTGATLFIGGTPRSVSLVELGRYFRGDFVTFWRAPQTRRIRIGLGDKGVGVDWLARQLAKVNGMDEPAANQSFDPAMMRRLHAFQLAHGLEADGVAGPKTFMYLNSIAGVLEPRLNGPALTATAGK
jgi:general secretion pathway protein A